MNMVQEWQNSENAGINAFLEHWDRKSDNIHVKISGKIDAVQIMTIHKSKGLEYKVVMYPYVTTKLPEKFHSTEKWIPVNNEDFNIPDKINNIIDDFMLPISSTLQYTDMKEYYGEELNKIAFDDINAIYVAMTRPKDVLYIYTDNKTNGDDNKNLFLDYDILNRYEKETDEIKKVKFKQIVKDEECKFDEYQLGEIEYHSDKKDDNDEKEITLKEGCNRDTIDWFKILKFDSISSINSEDDDAKKTGILVHEIYSKIMTLADAEGVIQYYLDAGHIDQKRADFLLKKFQMIAMNPDIKDAYSEKAIIKNEMGILTKESLKRPDRYAELEDRIILIDYKTGKRYDQYDEQMKKYVDALKGMGIEKNIEAYLLYIGKEDEKIKVIPAK
jgi:ATP-dependent exoDNAse (exonuclease V) beta subunit